MADIGRDGITPAGTSALTATQAVPVSAADPGQPGSRIADRYLLRSRIGRGGMADVYAAEDELLARPVAIKVFRVDASPDDRRRIDGEVRTLAALRNPGLVTVFDAGVLSGAGEERIPYLVMELITGPTLARLLRSGPLSEVEVARIGHELAVTLAYVHANNIVHRDIKPANILLDTDHPAAAPFTTKLADFGISRVTDSARFTIHGTTVGTPNYLSPEQAQGQDISTASDLYSLALVLIECLTGNVVYPGSGIDAAIARLHRPPTIPARLEPQWRQLLTSMTDNDPTARPTATDAADALATLRHDPAVRPEHISATAVTEMLSDLAPTSTAVLPTTTPRTTTPPTATATDGADNPATTGNHTRHFSLAAAMVLVVLLVIISAALSDANSTPPKPAYPTVSGQLGTDLTQLEGTLP